uniref:Uncharacterized protein n=1 Tax=Physcomitrium patens TaxID=3218 RepID=A0A2K1KTD7_PHYPA|nr:hypothetical protein PHYPA_004024 [Physcomitrium patens]
MYAVREVEVDANEFAERTWYNDFWKLRRPLSRVVNSLGSASWNGVGGSDQRRFFEAPKTRLRSRLLTQQTGRFWKNVLEFVWIVYILVKTCAV